MTSHALHVRICFKLLNHIPCNSPQHWAWFCARFHHHLKPTNCDSMRNLDFKSLFSYLKVRNLPVDICSTLSNFQFATNFSPFSSLANPKQSSPAFVKNYHHAPWWRKVERAFFNLIRPSPALAKKNVKKKWRGLAPLWKLMRRSNFRGMKSLHWTIQRRVLIAMKTWRGLASREKTVGASSRVQKPKGPRIAAKKKNYMRQS